MTFRWGIIGTGFIAGEFVGGNRHVENSEIAGVASLNMELAKEFCNEYACGKPYPSAEELVLDDSIDGIYIATPNQFHYEYMKLALSHNKHVYCEKPITMKLDRLLEVKKMAEDKNLLLLEGLWTNFLPAFKEVKRLIDEDVIGHISLIESDFGFYSDYDEKSRLYNKKLGGGALLDVGVYVIAMATNFYKGYPSQITAISSMGPSGVDHKTSMILSYDKNEHANLTAAIDVETRQQLVLNGTKGRIILDEFWRAQSYDIQMYTGDTTKKHVECPFRGNGHEYIIESFIDTIHHGKYVNDIFPIQQSVLIQEIMKDVMEKVGLSY
ncbi:dehydrogenase [Vallitalea longa]|uniref:Dehydrogenase n=1 Tax=Vallitalea longa TaxID=2936439 RepID=A0A9W6DGM4_9FIRM|nr:Gfo/Idh/MocA family oxidoreductase [Vallitalea longa]GKX30692.1 dehydrogenase [Vallitalea longa]